MKYFWKVFDTLILLGIIGIGIILFTRIINDPTLPPGDKLMIMFFASIAGIVELVLIIILLGGKRLAKYLYGDFSNRNPWGR